MSSPLGRVKGGFCPTLIFGRAQHGWMCKRALEPFFREQNPNNGCKDENGSNHLAYVRLPPTQKWPNHDVAALPERSHIRGQGGTHLQKPPFRPVLLPATGVLP